MTTENIDQILRWEMIIVLLKYILSKAINVKNRQVTRAKEALANVGYLYPQEGKDFNVGQMAQTLVNKVVSGVAVKIVLSSNSQVAANGIVIYGQEEVTGSVTFGLSKGKSTDTQKMTVVVAKTNVVITPTQINVKDYGARGDGITNDTTGIQNAINYASANKIDEVYIPDGIYQINPDVKINLKNGISLILADNAVLRSMASSRANYAIINIADVSNVHISGGSIIGDRTIHEGITGEWGHGINIVGSNSVDIANIAISNCWGDGIYVDGSASQNFSDTLSILGVTLNNNRRQGISIISARNLLLKDSTATNTNGTDPQSGLDLEPDKSTQLLQNIVIDNFLTANNAGFGITSNFEHDGGIPLGNVSIIIENHKDIGSVHGTFGNIFNYITAGYNIIVK